MTAPSEIREPGAAEAGRRRIDWAWSEMPVLRQIHERFCRERPLEGLSIGMCLHVTTETANLARTLAAGGARLALCASNPLSTQDDVAASLVVHEGIPVFAIRGIDAEGYYRHIEATIARGPEITLDDGADLVTTLHRAHPDRLPHVIGGTEETTTGVTRLRAMAADGALRYPIVAVNDAATKHLFDNRYGTGQSTLDGILRATNILLAGRTFTVVGYGWCGRGIALRARGFGAHVIVTEVDPVRALEASMDGYTVMPIREAAKVSDFIVTATGDKHVVCTDAFAVAKDGCVLANAGHFDVELDLPALQAMTVRTHAPRPSVVEHELTDGRRLRVLSEGRLVNLAAAEGHPSAVMDMSFANQALVVERLAKTGRTLEPKVHLVPAEIDAEVARLKLEALGLRIDTLTDEQRAYQRSWKEGT